MGKRKPHQRQNLINTAEKILASQMILVDFEGECISTVTADTELRVLEHHYKGLKMGWNVYAREGQNLLLLETYNSKKAAFGVVDGIRDGLLAGVTFYRLPGN